MKSTINNKTNTIKNRKTQLKR